jgi:hypothetical protein
MGVGYSTLGKAENVYKVQVVKYVGIDQFRVTALQPGSRRNDIAMDHIQNFQVITGQCA